MPQEKFIEEALTYDDVLLVPGFSEVLPHKVSTQSRLTEKIQLNVPIVSAAMDTVTEYELAIALAREGGLGFIHKNMPIEIQAEQVRKVKRSESGMILDPITLGEQASLMEAESIMKEMKIGGIPIVDEDQVLKGILTNRDMRFEKDFTRKVTEAMTKDDVITAHEGISLEEAENILHKYKIEKLPIVNEHHQLIGLITYKDILKKKHTPNACKDEYGRLRVGAAVGVTQDMLDRIAALMKAGVDVVGIDTAHGHSKGVIEAVREAKDAFPDLQIIAGNVATAEGAKALAEAGADGIKVGIGPGSICTTRVVAGVGVPQLYAVMEALKGLKGRNVPVIADGGIRYSGDIAKAIAAGANSVMIGSILSGTEEAPGEVIIYQGRKFKTYRGMGSVEAMVEGSKDRYFQGDEEDTRKLVPEGIVGRVPYKGMVSEVIYQLVGGLKSGMGYCGASTIPEMQEARFIKITHAGILESHPHDIQIVREAPNYSR